LFFVCGWCGGGGGGAPQGKPRGDWRSRHKKMRKSIRIDCKKRENLIHRSQRSPFMNTKLASSHLLVLVGSAIIVLAPTLSYGDGGGETTPCRASIGGDTTTMTSSRSCCNNSGCTGQFNVYRRGEWCISTPNGDLADCSCTAKPWTAIIQENGECQGAGSPCPSLYGECHAGTFVGTFTKNYNDCSGTPCTPEN
jgi:hypothetical protein